MLRLVYFCLLALLASSCAVTSDLTEVEVLVPGKNNLALTSDDRIMFVVDYKPHQRLTQNTSSAYVDDSIMVETTTKNIVSYFQELGNYEQSYVTIRSRLNKDKEAKDLTPSEIEQYSILEQPKYIINLALLRMLIKPYDENGLAYNSTCASLWRVYDAETGNLVHEMVSRDSIMFFKQQNVPREAIDSTIMIQMSDIVAEKISSNYFPTWQHQYRYYQLISDLEFYKVKELIENFKWDEVIALMEPYLASQDKHVVFAASFNIALACEMTGRFDLAIKWLDKAKKCKKNYTTEQYSLLLQEREKDLSNLPE